MEHVTSYVGICSRCETPLETGDLRCAVCGQASPHDVTLTEKVTVQVLRCTGCGAAVAYDPDHQAPLCSFCNSVVKVETIEDPMEQTEGYLPFTVSREQSRVALRNWLGSLGWFRPSDLKSAAILEDLRPLWWVAWVIDAESMVSWAADSNAGAHRSAWAPHSGQTNVSFNSILASASRGLSDAEAAAITPGVDLRSVQAHPEGAENATLEQFDVQRSQARQQVGATLRSLAVTRVQQSEIPGSNFRKVRVSVVVRKLITRRLSLPAYVLAYRYKNDLYRVVICGQDVRMIIGKAPYSMAKIVLVAAAVIGAILFVLMILASMQ